MLVPCRSTLSLAVALLAATPALAQDEARPVDTEAITVEEPVVPSIPPLTPAETEPRPVATETITVDQPTMPRIPADEVEVAEPFAATLPPELDVPEVLYDLGLLPEPVRQLRGRIMAAAATGDPYALRAIIDSQSAPPSFSFGHVEDPIVYLKSLSGDPEGREIMAILIEVLEAGFVHADDGTAEETYVWPYFARYPVEALTPRQLVELFKLVYAGDYEDMLAYGYYLSYRLGIAPDGTWRYFIAGD